MSDKFLSAVIVSSHPVATARPIRPARTRMTSPPINNRSRNRRVGGAVLDARGGGETLLMAIGCRLATDLGDIVMLFRFHEQLIHEL